MIALPPGEVHVWVADPADVRDPAHIARCEALLSDAERARGALYVPAWKKHEHIVSHALVRETLSRYAPVAPAAWRFAAGPHGRPEIAAPATDLRFNLSHADGLAACAVARGAAVGVDVESTDRATDTERVGARFFAPAEVAALLALPAAERRDAFFRFWTLKEAYLKARGAGLTIPLGKFAFTLPAREGEAPGLAIEPELADDARAWRAALLRPTPRHVLAVLLRHDRLTVTLRRCAPQCY